MGVITSIGRRTLSCIPDHTFSMSHTGKCHWSPTVLFIDKDITLSCQWPLTFVKRDLTKYLELKPQNLFKVKVKQIHIHKEWNIDVNLFLTNELQDQSNHIWPTTKNSHDGIRKSDLVSKQGQAREDTCKPSQGWFYFDPDRFKMTCLKEFL